MNKFESNSIQKQVKELYQSVFPEGGKLIIGVSGGPDSMALLYLLHKSDIPIFVVHINYGKRGSDSDNDQKLVEEICSLWQIECCSVSLANEIAKGNFQDWARNQRYQIFRDLKSEVEAKGIAIAHHKDDQVETILFKMLRGGGPESWKGLQAWDNEIFRPLLALSKEDILEFCETESVPYRNDVSNESNSYARNALRNTVFPLFDEFIPGWKSNTLEIGQKAESTDEALSFILDSIADDQSILIDKLAAFSTELSGTLIKKFIQTKEDIRLTKGQLYEILDLLSSQTGKGVQLNDQTEIVKDRGRLTLKKNQSDEIAEVMLTENEIFQGIERSNWVFGDNSNIQNVSLSISLDQIEWPLYLRGWKSGERFQPFGMDGTQKVSDHLTNRKINASQREDSLILIDSGGTICAILYPETALNGDDGCISELVKITKSTQNVLSISKA
jgi:tRNA(Ile)-lysidine synthase